MAKRARKLIAAVAPVAALFVADSAMAAGRHQTWIVLHVADYSQIPPAILARAQAEIATIHDRIGIDVVWTAPDCSENNARPHVLVTVRTEGQVGLDADTLARIASRVRELWRPYADIRFSFVGSEVRAPRRGDELELAVTDRTLPARDAGSLGWIEFVNGRPSQIITVSTTAARMLMDASSWNGRPLTTLPLAVRQTFLVGALSRSIAHEIGHYLLGSREHAVRGLMRGLFSASDILEPRRANDRLDSDEVQKINRHLLDEIQAHEVGPALRRTATPSSGSCSGAIKVQMN